MLLTALVDPLYIVASTFILAFLNNAQSTANYKRSPKILLICIFLMRYTLKVFIPIMGCVWVDDTISLAGVAMAHGGVVSVAVWILVSFSVVTSLYFTLIVWIGFLKGPSRS